LGHRAWGMETGKRRRETEEWVRVRKGEGEKVLGRNIYRPALAAKLAASCQSLAAL